MTKSYPFAALTMQTALAGCSSSNGPASLEQIVASLDPTYFDTETRPTNESALKSDQAGPFCTSALRCEKARKNTNLLFPYHPRR